LRGNGARFFALRAVFIPADGEMYGQQNETGAQRRRLASIGGGGGADAGPFYWRLFHFSQEKRGF
jgi:hypothetical protein